MAVNVLEVKDRVQRYLAEVIGTVQIDKEGDFNFRHGSSQVYVRIKEWSDDSTIVYILSPVCMEVPPSPELFQYIATNSDSYIFGHLSAQEKDDGVMVMLTHNLLGEFLDQDELKWALYAIAKTADEIDDEIKEKFGGKTFHED